MNKLKQLLEWVNEHNPENVSEIKYKIIEMIHKEKKSKVWQPPKQFEVITFFLLHGYREDIAIKAFDYYSAGDWHDSRGKKIMNWKLKMKGVWFKDENRIAEKPAPPQITQFFEYKDYVKALTEYNKKYGYNIQKSI